jgi:hypothetical protein
VSLLRFAMRTPIPRSIATGVYRSRRHDVGPAAGSPASLDQLGGKQRPEGRP